MILQPLGETLAFSRMKGKIREPFYLNDIYFSVG